MSKIILEVGDKVIKTIPDLGSIHGEIVKIINHSTFDEYEVQLTPQNYVEETLVQGLLSYNKKTGVNFWSVSENEAGKIISYGNLEHMLQVANF